MLDLSRIVPEARPVVAQAAPVYIRHAASDFVGLIAHGSAVKGGFIAGCSDIDFQFYLRPQALDADGHLPFARTVAVHRDLAAIDPAPFRYIQCYAFASSLRDGWTGPVPGAYTVLAGFLPVPEATTEQLRESALAKLAALDPVPPYLKDHLLDHGGGRLVDRTRLLCTDVWPVLYSLLIVRGTDPIAAWNMTKQQAIEALPPDTEASAAIRAFLRAVLSCYGNDPSPGAALDVLTAGVAFLTAVGATPR